jgi:hypothetical protein
MKVWGSKRKSQPSLLMNVTLMLVQVTQEFKHLFSILNVCKTNLKKMNTMPKSGYRFENVEQGKKLL